MKEAQWKKILVVAILSICKVASGCQIKRYSNANDDIQSNNYPNHYPSNQACTYIITATHGNKILLEFKEFDLEQSQTCSKDSLTILESRELVETRCGSDKRPYISKTNEVTLHFKSDGEHAGKGFHIKSKTCGGYYMNSYIYDIKSIGYNVLHYPINTTCTYKMTGIGDYGFKFVFNEFDLENSTGCENDKLSIYRGADSTSESNLIAKRCGRNRSELVSTSNQLTAQFITNSQISNTGFHISVYACYRLVTAERGTIASPEDNFLYPKTAFCLYEIKLAAGSKLKLEFKRWEISADGYLRIQTSANMSDVVLNNVTNVTDAETREYGNQLYLELTCTDLKQHGFNLLYFDNQGACSKYRPCQNGGNCTDIDTKNRTYSCACPLDYEGKNCAKKIIPCESNPCLNGGACENIPSRGNLPPTFKCTCVGDFTGQKCETLMGACMKYSPCQNNGQCVDIHKVNDTYRCDCALDYKGQNCSQLIIPCKSSPCLNQGACTDIRSINNMPPTFRCECTEEYKGTTCEHFIDGCKEYKNDSRWQRSISNKASPNYCDGSLQFSWYRFISNAGPEMPTACPNENSCGTVGSIWINGTFDLQLGNETDMIACARDAASCCSTSWDIRIKKCQVFNGSSFTVYRLRRPPSCPMAYCAGTELPCPTSYSSMNGFTPNCTETHPQILPVPRVYPDVEDGKLVIKCEFNSDTKEDAARFNVSWYEEFPLKQLHKTEVIKGTQRVARLLVNGNSSNSSNIFRLGKKIFCKVYSWYEGRPYGRVNGPVKESNHFFAGVQVKPSQTHYVMRETSAPLKLAVAVTVPIICNFSRNCSVLVRVTQDNSEVYFSLCSMTFENGSASQIFEISVKRDFIYGVNKQATIKLELDNKADPFAFNNHHEIPSIVITIIEMLSPYRCASTTDPNIYTFPGGFYTQHRVGYHVLARSTKRTFEVQSRTMWCSRGSCNCGVAAREGNDVIVIDFCPGAPNAAWFASQREPAYGTTLHVDSNGRYFQISFPSGAYITMNILREWSNIHVYVPPEDYHYIVGECKAQGYWAPGLNLFYYNDNTKTCREKSKEYCMCQGSSTTGYKSDCTVSLTNRTEYYQGQGKSVLLLHPTARECNTKESSVHVVLPRQSVREQPATPTPTPTNPVPTWPTPTGKQELAVKAYCEKEIRDSAVGKACASIFDFPFEDSITECQVNVLLTDSYDFTLSTIAAMQERCGSLFQNETLWVEDPKNNNTSGPPRNFTETLCPGLCNGQGTCVNSICICTENYTSPDCSIDKRMGPTVTAIRDGYVCDSRATSNCHLVRIIGGNFMNAKNSACRTTKLKVNPSGHTLTSEKVLHQFQILSFAEVMCTFSFPSSSYAAYVIDLTNDGSIFSANRIPYVIYDSKCLNCSSSLSTPPVCSIQKNTCNINGVCYLLGDASKSDPYAICNPSVNQTEFTKDHFPKLQNAPYLSLKVTNNEVAFACKFEAEKNEEKARFEVTWFEGSPSKKINMTNILKGLERSAMLYADFGERQVFSLGLTVYCRVRTWYINASVANLAGPYKESNHYYAGIKVEPDRAFHTLSSFEKPKNLTVRVTVPVICNIGNSCRILVYMRTDNFNALLNACILEFKPGPANQTQVIQIKPRKDFMRYGTTLTRLLLNISREGIPVGWKYHLPIPPVLLQISDVNTGHCQSSGDPHLITFDGLYYDHYKSGTYLLTKSKCRDFEVNVRTHQCSTVSCNCGVAAREGHDVIVIDFCKGALETVRFASQGVPANGTQLLRDRTGRNFIIKFSSGSFVQFNVFPYGSSHYANIAVQVPSDDFKCTIGLCGIFDGLRQNDFGDESSKVHAITKILPAPESFTESWRLDSGKTLFNYKENDRRIEPPKHFCSCLSNSSGHSVAECEYQSSQPTSFDRADNLVELLHPNANRKFKQDPDTIFVLPTNEKESIYTFKPDEPPGIIPDWPTKSGRTKETVEEHCNYTIRNSSSGRICSIIPDFPFHHFVQQCITDIQVTDTEFFTMSAIHSMQLACEEIFLKNMTYWKPNQNKNGTLEPRLDLKREMCPGLCSGNGVCTNSICKCNEPFTGDDCSVNKKVPPTIESLGSNGLCDAKKHNDCHIVWIRGSDFLDSENLACRTTYITTSENKKAPETDTRIHKARLLSYKDVFCNIINHTIGEIYANTNYQIEITNDRIHFSNTQDIYVIYDSTCMECSGKTPCKLKNDTCIIDGKCNEKSTCNVDYGKATDEKVTLIAVGCYFGVILLIAIVSLIWIRRKKEEDRMKAEKKDLVGKFELGVMTANIYSDDLGESKSYATEQTLGKSLFDAGEINILHLQGEEDKVMEADPTKYQLNKVCSKEESHDEAVFDDVREVDAKEIIVKGAKSVQKADTEDSDCANISMGSLGNPDESIEPHFLASDEEPLNTNKEVEPYHASFFANDLKSAIVNPSYEENKMN